MEARYNRFLLDTFVRKAWDTARTGVITCGVWSLRPDPDAARAGSWVDLRDGRAYDYETFCDVACSVILTTGLFSIMYGDLVLVAHRDTYFRKYIDGLHTIAIAKPRECMITCKQLLDSRWDSIAGSDRLILSAVLNFASARLKEGPYVDSTRRRFSAARPAVNSDLDDILEMNALTLATTAQTEVLGRFSRLATKEGYSRVRTRSGSVVWSRENQRQKRPDEVGGATTKHNQEEELIAERFDEGGVLVRRTACPFDHQVLFNWVIYTGPFLRGGEERVKERCFVLMALFDPRSVEHRTLTLLSSLYGRVWK